MVNSKVRGLLTVALLCAVGATAQAQDRSDWQSLARLRAGDTVRLSLKSGASRSKATEGVFQSWTPEQVTVGVVTAKKEDVRKIELYSQDHGMGHGKKALIGAAIGFGGGFALGAISAAHCTGFCVIGPGETGAALGGLGGLIGATIGALLPAHPRTKQVIYLAKP